MTPELQHEIERLRRIYAAQGRDFRVQPGASEEQIASVESETGIRFGPHLRDLWKYSDGSGYDPWFRVHRWPDDPGPAPCDFVPLADALKFWRDQMSYVAAVQLDWDPDPDRDPRIQPDTLEHRGWFPIAEFNGYSTLVLFDAAPMLGGSCGQIILYQHDPDTMLYLAPDFLSFFRASNNWLEAHPDEPLD